MNSLKRVCLFVAVLFFLCFFAVFFMKNKVNQDHQVLLSLYEVIDVGDNVDSLKPYIYGISDDFIVHEKLDLIEVISPYRFIGNTNNWIIYFSICDKKISAIFLRPMEGNFRICNAPQDKGVVPRRYQLIHKSCI